MAVMTKQEKIREMGYKLDDVSQHYCLLGAHRRDRFPWIIGKKMVAEMDDRDISALKDIVRMTQKAH